MSVENVRLFYEEIAKNEALQERFKSIGSDLKGQKLDEAQMEFIFQNEVLPVAKEYEFEFTFDEVMEYVKETNKPNMGDLSGDELEAVCSGNMKFMCRWFGADPGSCCDEDCSCVLFGFGIQQKE